MIDAERIEALLDLVDPTRTDIADRTEHLVIHGYAERAGRSRAHPTRAGWNLLGDQGRAYRTNFN